MKGSIRARNKSKTSWQITIDLGRDAEGKRRRKFVTVGGKKSDAQRRMRELLTSLDHGVPVNTEKITVSEWLDRWISEHITPTKRQQTTERYSFQIQKHIIPHIGHMQLTNVTPSDIKTLESTWATQGMSVQGISYSHRILTMALKAAVKMELLYRNPAQVVTPPRVEKSEVQPPSISIVNTLLTASQEHDDELFPALRLITYSGIRKGECLGLHWRDVDFDRQEISIVSSLVRSNEKGLIFEPPKSTASRRVINLDDGTVEVLRAHKVHQIEHRLIMAQSYEDNDLVFPNEFGQPLNPPRLTRALNRARKRIGAEHFKIHDLRHFHASLLLQNGQSPVLVSKRLGHSSVSMTLDIYGHLMPGWQREAAEVFAKAMNQGS